MRTIFALTIACVFVCVLAAAGASEGFAWGVNGHTISQVAYRDVPVTEQLDLLVELGAGWYRDDWPQSNFEKNLDRCDQLVADAARRKMRVLPVLFSSPGARSETATSKQIHAAAFAYASNVVSRYRGRLSYWELSNELDAHAMIRKGETSRKGELWKWDGAPDGSQPEHYFDGRYEKARAEILGLHQGVKAADPSAITIVDTAGWLHYGFIERLFKEDKAAVDVLAWHWYSEMGDMTKVQGKLDLISLLKGYGKPLWITEINRRDGSMAGKETEQATYLAQVAGQLRSNPAIEAFFAYELLDQPYFGASNGESHYGLVKVKKNAEGRWQVAGKKPAFTAFKSAIAGRR